MRVGQEETREKGNRDRERHAQKERRGPWTNKCEVKEERGERSGRCVLHMYMHAWHCKQLLSFDSTDYSRS